MEHKKIDENAQKILDLTSRLEDAEKRISIASGLGGVAVTVLADPRTEQIVGAVSSPPIAPQSMIVILRAAADCVQAELVRADERARMEKEKEDKPNAG